MSGTKMSAMRKKARCHAANESALMWREKERGRALWTNLSRLVSRRENDKSAVKFTASRLMGLSVCRVSHADIIEYLAGCTLCLFIVFVSENQCIYFIVAVKQITKKLQDS